MRRIQSCSKKHKMHQNATNLWPVKNTQPLFREKKPATAEMCTFFAEWKQIVQNLPLCRTLTNCYVDCFQVFYFPFLLIFWKRVANCSGWIMETLSRTKAETFVAFLATTNFCQQNKSASSSNIFHSQFADWGHFWHQALLLWGSGTP